MIAAIERTSSPRPPDSGRPLRVLQLTQASGAGVGRHFLDLSEGLAAEGVEVVGIYSPRKLDGACRARLAAGHLPPMRAFPMRRAVHPLDAADLWRLVRLIRQFGPFDIIHGHSSKGGALARLAARILGVPSVYTPNAFVTLDLALPPWQRSMYGRIERWLARRTDAIIAGSHDEVEHARSIGIDSRKLHVVPNGIDRPVFPSRELVRSQLGISPEELVVGFIGRLATQKAPDTMLDAFAQAFPGRSATRLVMIGGGPLEAEVRRHIERLGLTARVLLLGEVVATSIMPAFDVFCLSSRYEGMPYVYLEALAAGLPIVSTRVGGATMCVKPGENGLLVPPDDVAALAGALATLVQDASLRTRFAGGSARLATQFSAKQMVQQTLRVYDHVLATTSDFEKRPNFLRIE